MSAVTRNAAESLIVDQIHGSVGSYPVLLWGSRATGDALDRSDYDVYVVLPVHRIPLALNRLERTARSLGDRLGVGVSVSPIPAATLRREARLACWKVRRESRILAAPTGFELDGGRVPRPTAEGSFSYLCSAVIYLIEALDPDTLDHDQLPPAARRGVHKALLHTAQLKLMRRGCYEPDLDQALKRLGEPQLVALAGTVGRPKTWFSVRGHVLAEIGASVPNRHLGRALLVNAQYGALAAMSGASRWRVALSAKAIDERLADTAVRLLSAIEHGGGADRAATEAAAQSLPRSLRFERAPLWREVRDVVVREWAHAHPLVGL
jgi:predicted nucleotidyltransferase